MTHYEFSKPDPNAPKLNPGNIDRVQPTCVGTDEKGQLKWEARSMAVWQRLMFPIRYVGDFMKHWMVRAFKDDTGFDEDTGPSLDLEEHFRKQLPKNNPRKRDGD